MSICSGRPGGPRSDTDRQAGRAPQAQQSVPADLARLLQVRKAADQFPDGDPPLDSGEPSADAVVGAAEGDVAACVLAVQPQPAGVRASELLVAVGTRQAREDDRTGRDGELRHQQGVQGDPPGEVDDEGVLRFRQFHRGWTGRVTE